MPSTRPTHSLTVPFKKIFLQTFSCLAEIFCYPGLCLLTKLRNNPWPINPRLYFIQGFLCSLSNSIAATTAFLNISSLPPTLPPTHDLSVAREYRAFRNLDLPVFGTLAMLCAGAIALECAAWLYWNHERQRDVDRDVEARGIRLRAMYGTGGALGEEGGATGIVYGEGNELAKGEETR